MSQPIRVRFAPSPTGHLHIGGARTALFNFLFAKRFGGTFVLRLEDTDAERSTEESVQMILQDMKWLGLTWDEGPEVGGPYGPYRQTERLELYRQKAEELVSSGNAYYCFCTAENLESKRQQALASEQAVKYDRTCLKLTPAEVKARIAAGEPHTLRMRIPDGKQTKFMDLVRGEVVFENDALDDFVLIRSNGLPTYNYAAVIDDLTMKISHVIRGDDHISNTPRQICVYEALSAAVPQFAHVPMILGPDKTRLSKRHGATSVGAYADEGYLPEALVNYLALLGWSFDDKTTLFTQQELEQKFGLERVSRNPAVFDPQKLTWMNGQYIRSIGREAYVERSLAILTKAGLLPATIDQAAKQYATAAVEIVREKFKLMTELPQQVEYFFKEPNLAQLDEKSLATLKAMAEQPEVFKALQVKLSMIKSFSVSGMEEELKVFIEEKQVKFGVLAHPLRVCLTGRMQSPGIFEIMEILGQDRVMARLAAGMKAAGVV